jgi:hypothetical protein
MERFEMQRGEELQKYKYMERPMPALGDQLAAAVDTLCTLILDVKGAQQLSEADVSGSRLGLCVATAAWLAGGGIPSRPRMQRCRSMHDLRGEQQPSWVHGRRWSP